MGNHSTFTNVSHPNWVSMPGSSELCSAVQPTSPSALLSFLDSHAVMQVRKQPRRKRIPLHSFVGFLFSTLCPTSKLSWVLKHHLLLLLIETMFIRTSLHIYHSHSLRFLLAIQIVLTSFSFSGTTLIQMIQLTFHPPPALGKAHVSNCSQDDRAFHFCMLFKISVEIIWLFVIRGILLIGSQTTQ